MTNVQIVDAAIQAVSDIGNARTVKDRIIIGGKVSGYLLVLRLRLEEEVTAAEAKVRR